ncbi:MAG: hypothetical protein Q9185_002084 [Variospora sp. 1 TL-2023]
MHRSVIVAVHSTVLALCLPLCLCLGVVGNTKLNDIVTHKIDLNSINAKTVNYILPQAGQEVTLPASELTGGRNNIKLQVPPLEMLAAPGDFESRLTNVLNTSVPRALSEFGSDGAMAIEGMEEAVLSVTALQIVVLNPLARIILVGRPRLVRVMAVTVRRPQ